MAMPNPEGVRMDTSVGKGKVSGETSTGREWLKHGMIVQALVCVLSLAYWSSTDWKVSANGWLDTTKA